MMVPTHYKHTSFALWQVSRIHTTYTAALVYALCSYTSLHRTHVDPLLQCTVTCSRALTQAEDAHSRAAQRAEEAFSKLVALSKAYRKLEDDREALQTIATSAQAAAQVDVNAALRERDAAHSRAAVAEAAAADRARAVTEAEQR
jgi:hypothetical protein